jgi:hypothetical protein
VKVGGQVTGSTAGGDGFGFVAQQVGALSIGGAAISLHAGASNDQPTGDPVFDPLTCGQDRDVRLREV